MALGTRWQCQNHASGLIRGRYTRLALALTFFLCLPSTLAATQGKMFTRELTLQHAAFHPAGVPNVVVHGAQPPPSAPINLVVFLHGFRGCAKAIMAQEQVRCGDALVAGQNLAAPHDAAGTNSILVVPQLALLKRSGAPGAFGKDSEFRVFLKELLDDGLAGELGPGAFERLHEVVLIAHSAGYQAMLAILARGQVNEWVTRVVLLDALYGGNFELQKWLKQSTQRHVISLYSRRGKPAHNTKTLERSLRRAGHQTFALNPEDLSAHQNASVTVTPARAALAWAELKTPHSEFPQAHLAAIERLLFAP